MKDWIAGSDFSVPANQARVIDVALTPNGERLARAPGGYRGEADVLLNSGYEYVVTDRGAPPTIRVHG
jgi:hypothetical protein